MVNDIIEDWFTKRGFMATLIMEGERAGQHVLEVRTSHIYTICKQYSILDKYQSAFKEAGIILCKIIVDVRK